MTWYHVLPSSGQTSNIVKLLYIFFCLYHFLFIFLEFNLGKKNKIKIRTIKLEKVLAKSNIEKKPISFLLCFISLRRFFCYVFEL